VYEIDESGVTRALMKDRSGQKRRSGHKRAGTDDQNEPGSIKPASLPASVILREPN
jgi:hypothetical protein